MIFLGSKLFLRFGLIVVFFSNVFSQTPPQQERRFIIGDREVVCIGSVCNYVDSLTTSPTTKVPAATTTPVPTTTSTHVTEKIIPENVTQVAVDGSGEEPDNPKLFSPPDGQTMTQWLYNHGMSPSMAAQWRQLSKDVQKMIIRKYNQVPPPDSELDGVIGDLLLTIDQLNDMKENLSLRKKRKILKFGTYPSSKWNTPADTIKYKFSGDHTAAEEQVIRNAIAHWEQKTCLRFQQIPTSQTLTDPHLLFSRDSGCFSYVGRVTTFVPQQVNLGAGCADTMGTPIHEIGHAIGLFHEQVRPDRDAFVTINAANIRTSAIGNYDKQPSSIVETLGVPYDYASIMHYSDKHFLKSGLTTEDTMVATDSKSQSAMGQRVELTFYDAKIVNLAYCSGVCTNTLPQPCQRDGYQDPNNCNRCLCPEGFGGTYCEAAEDSSPGCSPSTPTVQVSSTTEQCVQSPNYPSGYSVNSQCNWLFQAPTGCKIDLTFRDQFGVYCEPTRQVCYHWVELRTAAGLNARGPRFCCNNTPSGTITSDSNEAVVTFDSIFQTASTNAGFKLCYKLSSDSCITTTAAATTSATTTAATTTASATTSTTATTASTAAATTTTTTAATTQTTTPTTRASPAAIVASLQCRRWSRWSDFNQRSSSCRCGYQYRIRYCVNTSPTGTPQCRWDMERREVSRCNSYVNWNQQHWWCRYFRINCRPVRYRCCSNTNAAVEQRQLPFNTAAQCLTPLDNLMNLNIYGLDDADMDPGQLLNGAATNDDGSIMQWYSPLNQDDAFNEDGYMEEEYEEGDGYGQSTQPTPLPGQFEPLLMDDSNGEPGWSDWGSI